MDQQYKDQIAKIICYGLGCLCAYYFLMWILPYLAIGFALYAFGYFYIQTNRRR